MLELDHIHCLLDVADTRSFSRSAERLGLAQSVVSKRVRRVEEQLGLRIFARTSRSVELTRQGRAFLPYAQAMVDAETTARYAAKNLHEETAGQLVLGTYDFLIHFRMELMDLFHAEYPAAHTEVVYGSRPELFAGIRTGKLDVVMMASLPNHFEPDFATVKLAQLEAHLLVPPGHPLFDRRAIEPADLDNAEIVYSPSHQDQLVRAEISTRLVRRGAKLVLAPEAHRPAMEHFARIRGIPVLRWRHTRQERMIADGWAQVPFDGVELKIELVVYASRTEQRQVAVQFLETARKQHEILSDLTELAAIPANEGRKSPIEIYN